MILHAYKSHILYQVDQLPPCQFGRKKRTFACTSIVMTILWASCEMARIHADHPSSNRQRRPFCVQLSWVAVSEAKLDTKAGAATVNPKSFYSITGRLSQSHCYGEDPQSLP